MPLPPTIGSGISLMQGLHIAGFSPLDLTPALWLDGADSGSVYQDSALTTPAVSDGDPVGGWKDRSGNANHLLQATEPKRPILKLALQNGRNGVRLDGLDDLLATAGFTLNQPWALFLVAKVRAWTLNDYVCDGLTGDSSALLLSASIGNVRQYAGAYGAQEAAGTAAFRVICSVFAGADSRLRVDGAAAVTGNPGAGNPGGLTIGSANVNPPADLDVCEILAYPSALSEANEAVVRNYLTQKWGL